MSYSKHFDRLGNLVQQSQPWQTADLIRCLLAVAFVVAAIVIY